MKNNKLSWSNVIDVPDIRLFEVSGIRPDILPSNPAGYRILKKA
jgi:hypothetical protein